MPILRLQIDIISIQYCFSRCSRFPGVFYEDIDFDGTKDLTVSPNSDNEI